MSVDPVIIRLGFTFILIFKLWLGLVAYMLAAMLIPERSSDDALEAEIVDHPHTEEASNSQGKLAVVFIVGGAGWLLYRFTPRTPQMLGYFKILRDSFWPLALIAVGLWLIFRSKK
jgi:hypothetical protein